MYTQTVEVINPSGLHSRPASSFVRLAASFQSKIKIRKIGEDLSVNAKAIVMLLTLECGPGDTVEISAEGDDEKIAVNGLVALIQTGFGE